MNMKMKMMMMMMTTIMMTMTMTTAMLIMMKSFFGNQSHQKLVKDQCSRNLLCPHYHNGSQFWRQQVSEKTDF
jgi:hypothetical protein